MSSKTRGGYAAFKINASKKEGGTPESALDQPNLQGIPPKLRPPRLPRKPVGFYHQGGTFWKIVAGVRIELTLPQLMRLVSLPRLVPAI